MDFVQLKLKFQPIYITNSEDFIVYFLCFEQNPIWLPNHDTVCAQKN